MMPALTMRPARLELATYGLGNLQTNRRKCCKCRWLRDLPILKVGQKGPVVRVSGASHYPRGLGLVSHGIGVFANRIQVDLAIWPLVLFGNVSVVVAGGLLHGWGVFCD